MQDIQIMNLKDGRKPSLLYDFRIDRSTPVGNQYYIPAVERKRHGIPLEIYRKNAIEWYQDWFDRMTQGEDKAFHMYINMMEDALRKYDKLRLFCWCAPKQCHGEIIRAYLQEVI